MKSEKKIDDNVVANLHLSLVDSILSRITKEKKRTTNEI